MAQLSMNEITTYRWSFEEDIAGYVAAEITSIGVWRRKLADFGEEKGGELLAESGLEVSHLQWAGGFTGSDGRSFRESVADGLQAIRLAAQLRAGCLVVFTGGRAGHTYNHARRMVCDALRELSDLAAELHVTLALEPMHPGCATEWTFVTNLGEAVELLDEVDRPGLKIVFDTYHLCHDPSVIERIPDIASRIGLVQLGDGKGPPDKEQNRSRLSEGELPLRQCCHALQEAGFDGYFDVELIGEEIEASDYGELIRHSRNAFVNLTA